MSAIENPTSSALVALTINGDPLRARRRCPPPARAFPARRPAADRHPHRLRHRLLRRLHGARRRRGGQELLAARDPARRTRDPHRRGARPGRPADAAPALVLGHPRPAVRLLHARHADERDRPARAGPRARRGRDPQGHPGQHLPLHGLRQHRARHLRRWRRGRSREHRRGRHTTGTETWKGISIPRKEDGRLVQGQGQFVDDRRAHGAGFCHFVRSPYGHATIVSIDVEAALQAPGVLGVLTPDEVVDQTDPFFQIAAPPGRPHEGLLPGRRQGAPHGRARRRGRRGTREQARDAADLVEIEYEPLEAVVETIAALDPRSPLVHEEPETNLTYEGKWAWGDCDAAFAEADAVVKIDRLHFHRFTSTPLECAGALVDYDDGHGALHDPVQPPDAGRRRRLDGAGAARAVQPAAAHHRRHRRRVRQQDHLPPLPRRPLPAGAQAAAARSTGPRRAPSSTWRAATATSAPTPTSRSACASMARSSRCAARTPTTAAPTRATSRSGA